MTGWIATQLNVKIDYDIERTPLEIRSNSELGSGDQLFVNFYPFSFSRGEQAGGVSFELTSTPKYCLYMCRSCWTNFPTDLPTARTKIWRITVIRSSVIIGVQILCNGEEVLNIVLSDSVCTSWNNWYNNYWNRSKRKIQFYYSDTISYYYRPYQPGIY